MLGVLVVEDSEDDAILAIETLRAGGLILTWERVESLAQLRVALTSSVWDVILSDYSLPGFTGMAALALAAEFAGDVPFIVVSGTIGEEAAAEAMRAGARDIVIKGKFSRLVPIVERELREADVRRERRRADAALRESEETKRSLLEELRTLVQCIPDVIARLDRHGRFLYVSPAIEELTGIAPAAWIGNTAVEMAMPHPVCVALERGVRTVFSSGESAALDFELDLRGRNVAIEGRVVPQLDPDGSVQYVIGVLRDVTEVRRKDAQIRESESNLRRAQRTARLGNWEWVQATDTVTWSDELFTLFALDPTKAPPSLAEQSQLYTPESFARLQEAATVALETGEPFELDVEIVRCEGRSLRWAAVYGEADRDRGGRIVGLRGTLQDVTERRRAEAERQALADEIKLLLESTYEGIYVIDSDGMCTLVNRAATAMLGYSADELLGKDPDALIHHHGSDRSEYPVDECPIRIAASQTSRHELIDEVLWRKDGTCFPVEIFISPIMCDDGTAQGIVVSFTDVTAKRLLHAELERATRLASLGRITATMSHEFNNVLMAIQPFAEVITRAATDSRIHGAAGHIAHAVQRGRGITQDLLRFTRPAELVEEAIRVTPTLSQWASEFAGMLPSHIVLDFRVADESLVVRGDRGQIAQAVSNLVINARDAMGDTPGTITIGVRRCLRNELFAFGVVPEAHRYAHFTVTDEGPGIPPPLLPQVFEPFFTTKPKGTGLGLAIAHQILSSHGGHIFATNAPGRGAAIHFFVPLGTAEAVPIKEPEVSTVRHLPSRILMVEDDESVALGTALLLEAEQIVVDIARTGAEALKQLESRQPEVVILDVGLPDMDGVTVCEQMRRTHPLLPVIFSSGHAGRAALEDLERLGPARLLLKPYPIEVLLELLAETMNRPVGVPQVR